MKHPFRLAVSLTPFEQGSFLPEPLFGQLRDIDPQLCMLDSRNDFAAALAKAAPEVLLTCWSTPPLINPPPSLRYVCHITGTVKRLLTRKQIEDGLTVTNWGNSVSRTVAEATLWHILTCLRRGTYWTFAMHQGQAWRGTNEDIASLFCRRVGIHGFGNITRDLLKLLQPFGCPVSVLSSHLSADKAQAYGVTLAPSLEALFSENDIVVDLAPLTPATTGIINEALLRRLRPGCVFVNLGRGPVVDEAALIRVAREGKILFGLDVFADEPLPADSPLRGMSNVFLTPHLAMTPDRHVDAGAFALANLQAYANEQPLKSVVTLSVYDSST
ncbi:MAG: hydroxyacid dehydrogenase [Opitutaceae bacterium]|jgi:phosphoglycerate dehydrogenase-like enzyme